MWIKRLNDKTVLMRESIGSKPEEKHCFLIKVS